MTDAYLHRTPHQSSEFTETEGGGCVKHGLEGPMTLTWSWLPMARKSLKAIGPNIFTTYTLAVRLLLLLVVKRRVCFLLFALFATVLSSGLSGLSTFCALQKGYGAVSLYLDASGSPRWYIVEGPQRSARYLFPFPFWQAFQISFLLPTHLTLQKL